MKRNLISASCPLHQPTPAQEAAIVRYYVGHTASTQQTAREILGMNHLAVYEGCGFYQEDKRGTVIVALNWGNVELFAYDHITQEVTLIRQYRRRNAMVVYAHKQVSQFLKHLAHIVSTVTSNHLAAAFLPNSQV